MPRAHLPTAALIAAVTVCGLVLLVMLHDGTGLTGKHLLKKAHQSHIVVHNHLAHTRADRDALISAKKIF